MAGFIYIFSNASLEGLKIGKTKSDPAERARELSTTSVPSPFKVEYFAFVDDFDRLERDVHRRLDKYRKNKNREFFDCSVTTAMDAIRTSAGSKLQFETMSKKQEAAIISRKQKKDEEEKRKTEKEQRKVQAEKLLKEKVLSSGNWLDIYLWHFHDLLEENSWRNLSPLGPPLFICITFSVPALILSMIFFSYRPSGPEFFWSAIGLSYFSIVVVNQLREFRLKKYFSNMN